MAELSEVVRARHSSRVAFDPGHAVSSRNLAALLDAARWAPTPHNMQNFEIVAIDDPNQLARIGALTDTVSLTFLRENDEQVARSDEELATRQTGISARGFAPAWLDPQAWEDPERAAQFTRSLRDSLDGCPLLFVFLHDPARRAPASEGDVLGWIGLGCVLENVWLTAQSLGLGCQVLASLADEGVEPAIRNLLGVPDRLRVALGCRLGYPLHEVASPPRVRRDAGRWVHHNAYGVPLTRALDQGVPWN